MQEIPERTLSFTSETQGQMDFRGRKVHWTESGDPSIIH